MADSTGILQPYPVLFDKSGQPLDAGYVYVGEYGLNPETSQINVYWDENLTQPAPQPIRTINGYYSRNGTPAKIFIGGISCSISVRDKSQSLVFNDLFSSGQFISTSYKLIRTVDSIEALRQYVKLFNNQVVVVESYTAGTNIGGGEFYADESDITSSDNGVNIIVSADGTRWKRRNNQLSFADSGCIGSGDDTTALTRMFNYLAANGGVVNDYSGKTFTFISNITCNAPNKKISINTNCSLYSDTGVLTISGSIAEIGYIASAATLASKTIALSSAPTLVNGDIIAIQNTRTSSFALHRTYYYDGEFTTVDSVSGVNVTLIKPLETAYPSGIEDKVYKISPVFLTINGLTVTGNKSSALFLSLCAYSDFNEMNVYNLNNDASSNNALLLDRCYMSSIDGGRYIKKGLSGTGTDYGITIANCQDLLLKPKYAYGARHGISTGGFDISASVPNRRIYIENAQIVNDPTSLLQAADFHGNIADSHYRNCNIIGRITLSGYNCKSIRNSISSPVGEIRPPIQLSEVVGGEIESNGDTVYVGAASNVMAWGTSTDTAKVTKPCSFNLQEVTIESGANLIGLIAEFNLPVEHQVVINDFGFDGGFTTITRLVTYTAGAESTKPSFIQITGNRDAIPEAVLYIAGDINLTTTTKQVFSSSGSGANGTWIKQSDGTMICRHKLSATVAINTAYAGGFKSADFTWTYPKAFVSTPPIIVLTSSDNACISAKYTGATVSQATIFGFAISSFASAGVIIDAVAIGRHLY